MNLYRILCGVLIVVLLSMAAIGRVVRQPSRPRPHRSVWHIGSGDAITLRDAMKILAIMAIAFAIVLLVFTIEGYFFHLHD